MTATTFDSSVRDRLPSGGQPVGSEWSGVHHRHASAGAIAGDAARARFGGGPEYARLHQRLPRFAAGHGRPGGLEGGQEVRESGIRFVPAITKSWPRRRCWARSASSPTRAHGRWRVRHVVGKGPGVDRAGDAIKHGNAYGSSPHGGVLVVAGDDHGCVSSSMPHQSDHAFQAWQMRSCRRPMLPRC